MLTSDTVRRRDLLNEFGRRGVLPKYGFPVDVVELHTEYLALDTAKDVELQRDLRLALSEFAPGSELVMQRPQRSGRPLRPPRFSPIARNAPRHYTNTCHVSPQNLTHGT